MENEAILLRDLQSPVKSNRLAAIGLVWSHGASDELQREIVGLARTESDDEVRMLMLHTLRKLGSRAGVKPAAEFVAGDEPTQFAEQFALASPEQKIDLLSALPAVSLAHLAPAIPALTRDEASSGIKIVLIKTFARVWPEAALDELASYLTAESVGLRTAALDVLIARAPALLIEPLSVLLRSDDLRLRALAVRGLAQIDIDEALLYLEAMLLDANPASRSAALRTASLLPFEHSRDVILKYLSVETDPDLIRQAGLLFRMNPDRDAPYRLWELAETSPAAKASQLKELIQNACKAIHDAGGLGEPLAEYTARLQKWIYQRTVTHFVLEFANRFVPDDPTVANELRGVFAGAVKKPMIRQAFADIITRDPPPDCRSFVEALLREHPEVRSPAMPAAEPDPGAATPATPTTPATPAVPTITTEAVTTATSADPSSAVAQLCDMAGWPPDRAAEATPILQRILDDTQVDASVRGSALRAAHRLGITLFIAHAHAALKSGNPTLTANALEYLATTDPDNVLPLLGRFLKGSIPRLKSTAIKILKQADVQTATSSLMAMLRSRDEAERKAAVQCLVHFDFLLIRDQLCSLVLERGNEELITPVLTLFESNPDPDHLFPLYSLERQLSLPLHVEAARKVRRTMVAVLVQFGRLPADATSKIESELQQRLERSQQKKAVPAPAYAFKKNAAIAKVKPPERNEAVAQFVKLVIGFVRENPLPVGAMATVVVMMMLGSWLLSGPTTKARVAMPPLNQSLRLNGYVCYIPGGTEFFLVSSGGLRFRLSRECPDARKILAGRRLRITVVPLAINADGDVVATMTSPIKEIADD